MDNPDILEVILPIDKIPNESVVRKINGEKLFRVTRKIHIFNNDPNKTQIINCENGCAFLTSATNSVGDININMVASNTKMVWLVDKQTFHTFLSQELD